MFVHLNSSYIDIKIADACNETKQMKWEFHSTLGQVFFNDIILVESVLLYGAETWTLTAQQEKALDGVYTRMLRIALNVSWNDYVRNVNLYGGLTRISAKVR